MHTQRRYCALLGFIAAIFLTGCSSIPGQYTISGLTPFEVTAGSSDFVLLVSGSNFKPTSKVLFGSVTLTPDVASSNLLQVTVPASAVADAGFVDVAVTGSPTSSPVQFTVRNPLPAIAGLSQSEALLNSTAVSLDITGSNFVSTSTVKLGDSVLKPTSITSSHLTVGLPDALLTAAQILNLSVVNPGPGGGDSSPASFTVLNPQPAITALSAEETLLNSPDLALVISGTGFAPGMKVDFGFLALDPAEINPARAIVLVPAAAFAKSAIHNVTVVNGGPGGGTSNQRQFTVRNPMPSLASLSATSVLAGSGDLMLNLTGSGFVPGESTVHFDSLALTPASSDSGQLSVLVPQAALAQGRTVAVSVTTGEPGGGQSNTLEFTVENPVPKLTGLSLNGITAGSAALDLTLTGTDFVQGVIVSLGGVRLMPSAVSGAQITVTVPAESLLDAGEFPVLVSNPGPGGGPSNALLFTISNPQPVLTAISPSTAIRLSTDTTLTITGSGFVHQSTVLLGATTLVPASWTSAAITVIVPSTALSKTGRVDVSVVNPAPGGGSSNTGQISVANPEPVVSTVSPSSVSTSSSSLTVVLNGTGFNEDTIVKMTSSASGTVVIPTESIEPTAIRLSISATDLSSAGTLVFMAQNPGPGGGDSALLKLVVHERAENDFYTVVNNQTPMPGGSGTLFNSYNQPSISNHGTVVFKGQSKGQSGPIIGIYARDMSCARGKSCGGDMSGAGQVRQFTARGVAVPQPNNTLYNGSYAPFNQFPSFPRIDMDTEEVTFRGESRPTWTFTTADGLESRIGSAGIFTSAGGGDLKTAVGLLGALTDFQYFKVPSEGGIRFDQFPGSPAIDHNYIAFKGNYTVGDTGKTGVYFRDVVPDSSGESPVEHPVYKIADSDTLIPGQPQGGSVFGSTAPPSAAQGKVVFVGLDNEDAPTLGGIYLATLPGTGLIPDPAGLPLTPLVTVGANGTQVPGEANGVTFTHLREGLSFDGRYVGFWAAWGTTTRTRTLICGVDGNQELLDSCLATYPHGFPTEIPIHQGIFVYDTQDNENPLHAIVKTDSGEFSDFVYWVFSGRPPNVGGNEGGTGTGSGTGGAGDGGTDPGPGPDVVPEPPRWRSSAFVAVEGAGPDHGPYDPDLFKVAFKAQSGTMDGVYLAHSFDLTRLQTVVDTATAGSDIDHSYAPADSVISAVGLERDGLRNDQLVVTATMLNSATTESNAGVYITTVKPLSPSTAPPPTEPQPQP